MTQATEPEARAADTDAVNAAGATAARHRSWKRFFWSLTLAWVLTAFACLMYAVHGNHGGGAAQHVAAIVWQSGQMAAIICFALGMWQSQKQRRWEKQQRILRGEFVDPWD